MAADVTLCPPDVNRILRKVLILCGEEGLPKNCITGPFGNTIIKSFDKSHRLFGLLLLFLFEMHQKDRTTGPSWVKKRQREETDDTSEEKKLMNRLAHQHPSLSKKHKQQKTKQFKIYK